MMHCQQCLGYVCVYSWVYVGLLHSGAASGSGDSLHSFKGAVKSENFRVGS